MKHAIAPARATGPFNVSQLSLCIAMALPGFVHAQQSPASAVALPEVTIKAQTQGEVTQGTGSYTSGKAKTATPLSMSLRDTPQSVSVVTQQRMEDQGLQNITDAINNTTGVSVRQYETNRAQFISRGFDINALMIDGVPTTWDQAWSSGEVMTSLALYDRVEVVRGSTGLTTGAGDPSAAINMVRKRANNKALTGTAELGLGSWNERRAAVDLSTPVNEAKTLRARVVGEHSERDSWVEDLKNKRQTVYATIEADLGTHTLLSAGFSHQENNQRGAMWGGLPVWYSNGARTNWDRSKTTAADWTRYASVYEDYFATLEHKLDNDWKLKASYTTSDRLADSYLLYVYGTPNVSTGLGMSTWPGAYKVKTKQEDISLQASGPFDLMGRTHEMSMGYVQSKQNFNADSRSASGGSAPNFNTWDGSYAEPAWGALSYYSMGTVKQEAVYGAARFNVTDPLKLVVGARLSNYERAGDTATTNPFTMTVSQQVTPYAGLVYDLSDSYSLYGSYTDIFQPQQKRDINGKYLDPILGKSTELGVKGEFLDGRVNASAAIFQITQDNLAQSTGVNIPNTTPAETAYRASKGATSEGFELDVAGELSPGWNLSAGYTQFRMSDAAGADVNTINPRRLLRVFTSYRLPGALSGLTLGGGVNWQDATYTYATNPQNVSERIEQGAYALVNLMVRYDFSKKLSGQININNLLDTTYFAMFDAYNQLTYGAPRSTTATLKYKF
ncbi:TonB-dependent siderophore receptor [Rhodoferax sp. TS-BS-61-7]|uniref:TonB-dependent siderophore receptor n=1 Tax=Rhodoferax sp. TS-BS-61-7 TaxID=2094194 RepID=UPI001F02866D|nr:TonB-dependent siderophore receptor [Rhodoferax sp. TS-BS-61-7]